MADAETAERVLGRVAACVGAARYPARRARLARLRAWLAARPDRARTLGGCRFVPWRGRLLVLRELAAAGAAVRLQPGARLLWDRRFAVDLAPAGAGGLTLGYLGSGGGPAAQRGGRRPAAASSIRFCRRFGTTRVWRRCRISATVAPAWGRCHRFLSVRRSRLHKRALQLFNRGSILSFACAETPARFERARCPRR